MLPKCKRQHVALAPQLDKSDEIDVGNNRIDEDERNQANDVSRCMYRWKLMEIGSRRVDFTERHKSEWEQNEIEEDDAETCFVDVVPEDAGEYHSEWQKQSCKLCQDAENLGLGSLEP